MVLIYDSLYILMLKSWLLHKKTLLHSPKRPSRMRIHNLSHILSHILWCLDVCSHWKVLTSKSFLGCSLTLHNLVKSKLIKIYQTIFIGVDMWFFPSLLCVAAAYFVGTTTKTCVMSPLCTVCTGSFPTTLVLCTHMHQTAGVHVLSV